MSCTCGSKEALKMQSFRALGQFVMIIVCVQDFCDKAVDQALSNSHFWIFYFQTCHKRRRTLSFLDVTLSFAAK